MITLATKQDIQKLQAQIDELRNGPKVVYKGDMVTISDKKPSWVEALPKATKKKRDPKETRQKITEILKDGKIYSVAKLMKVTHKSSGAVSGMLCRLIGEGKVKRVGQGLYQNA
jgi:predicted Rossmann fold nucleotide-binding protein DprA/Smf involved in DNA uptake